MKKTGVLMALLLLFSVSAMAAKHTVKLRGNLADANVNGKIDFTNYQLVEAGTEVEIYSVPNPGYGMSRGIFYATVKNGVYSETQSAKPHSKYPEDRANRLTYRFTMPDADVELWAYFTPLRTLVIHKPVKKGGKLIPLYGYKNDPNKDTVVYNVPFETLKLKVDPDEGYELVDVDVENLARSNYKITNSLVTVTMPNKNDIVHVTPVFGKLNYEVKIDKSLEFESVTLSNNAPKSREEVEMVLTCKKGYIPSKVSIEGCKNWWRDGKPQLLDDGRWRIVYRFKVDLQDINITLRTEPVYTITVNDTKNSKRVETYIPEMIPDFPGVARTNQEVPVVFKMPANYSATYTAKNGRTTVTPLVYHNALENSFADDGITDWLETNDYVGKGLPIKVETDSTGNKYWCTSVKNTMMQGLSLKGRSYPSSAVEKGLVSFAAIASINPRYAQKAEISIETSGDGVSNSTQVVADMQYQGDGWQTVLTTGKINTKADTLLFVVRAEAETTDGKRNYYGPMFDDLCLLFPTDDKTIQNEDVMIFKINGANVTIDYTPSAKLNTVSIEQKDHATVTLINSTTDEQGDTVKAMTNDVIVVKGKYDEGYAIYDIRFQDDNDSYLELDSINTSTREVTYHFIMREDMDVALTPDVDVIKVNVEDQFGGLLAVNDTLAKTGEKVLITVEPNSGCKLKQIRTIPANIVTITADNVDAKTGAGNYSFVMPTTHVTLIAEYIVPITKPEMLDSINVQYGEFNLERDLVLDVWKKKIGIYGQFNGNGHRITYTGSTPLFYSVYRGASVRHLYVNATVEGKKTYMGGITQYNEGVIEDCEVSGLVKNKLAESPAAGIAGQNGPDGGIISHCHVLCDIDGATTYGITSQESGATVRDNVFNGRFAKNDGDAYMICNDNKNSTIQNNSYIANDGNSTGLLVSGVTAAQPADLVDDVKDVMETYPVFAASIRNKYNAFTITVASATNVTLEELSATSAGEGTQVSGMVSVDGNNHLESITISASDGSKPQNCTFTDNTENHYYFSFTMPDYDILISFKTQEGTFIYTARQLADLNEKTGLYILANDLYLNNWNEKVTLKSKLYGNGHTIRYETSGDFKGLFYKIKKEGLLQGLRVVGFVETNVNCGGIAFENYGTIRDCHFLGRISRLEGGIQPANTVNRVAAIAYKLVGKASRIDHCSATGQLICPSYQNVVNSNPLCTVTGKNVISSHWVNPNKTDEFQKLISDANAASNDYPIYAQGILDQINPRIVTGSKTIRVENGTTLDELIITDGEPFICTADVKVNKIIYKRQATNALEQWVLPFGFDQIAGKGAFEYHKIIERTVDEVKLPDVGDGTTLTLAKKPSSIDYKANELWMVKNDGNDVMEYTLTNAKGSITIKATHYDHIAQYASITDIGDIYTTYTGIPAVTAKEDIMYVWNRGKQEFVRGDVDDIQSYRFYLQFYNKNSKKLETYDDTKWAKDLNKSGSTTKAPRRLASAMADGWQPIFLDPRQPQSVTARMLAYYDVAYLADIRAESFNEETDSPISAVSLVYQLVNSRMELPSALPLLVRAKRADAEPLVNAQMGAEIDTLYTLSLLQMMIDEAALDIDVDDEEEIDTQAFEMPHYWCAAFGKRLDIWPIPSSEKYADLATFGCLMFEDNYFDQSFNYATANDNRTTAPMSYCITVYNTDTYEILPLMGDCVNVEFIESAETTGISLTPSPSPKGEGSGYTYNLNGQRVGAGYKGIIIQNGRKIYKR